MCSFTEQYFILLQGANPVTFVQRHGVKNYNTTRTLCVLKNCRK
jgi:hypothetical protein